MATGKTRRRPSTRRKPSRAVATRKSRSRRTVPRSSRRARQKPETLRLRSFTPGLTANDLERSMSFYTGALGFVVSERWTQDGRLLGVMLKAGRCELGLSQDDWAKGRERSKGVAVRIWCETVQDVDALAGRVKAAGYALTEEPHDQQWGGRAFSVDDPDGFHLTVFKPKPKA
jgi:uncharacterized glyoxalase superfamily protein PhnB